ncbi:MAG: tetratricopeptide repeat protein [Burkholderiales bacterium]|nr:tetratricopeptide repeat protein [Burkholderiales bacterium]
MNVSRNEPCSCGSGLKYKRCCGRLAAEPAILPSPAPSAAPGEFEQLIALFHAERYAELESRSRLLLERHPDSGLGWKLLGAALGVQGKDALPALQYAAELSPDDVDAHNNLGNVLQDLGQFEGAVASYRRALALKPDFASAHYNLGIALCAIGRLDEAVASYRRALEIKPDYAEAFSNLGNAQRGLGQLDSALASYRSALAIKPDCQDANRAYLTALLYLPDTTVETLCEAHAAFVARMRVGLSEIVRPSFPPCDARKKLRIGYVSSDFRNHPVGRNIMPLMGHHDRSKFEVYLYGDVKRPDGMTDWFKSAADGWRSIVGISDEAAAEMIRRDGIDVLVLLAGRFDDNRPLIVPHWAAPVQVSFHDPATSGLKAMDYLITDHGLSPRDTLERFTERLFHLPAFYVHPPLINVPDVNRLPAREKEFVTFGSFNNPSKVNEQVVALWSRVLLAVPDSRLIMKYKNIFWNESIRRRYFDLFLTHGIEAQRLDLVSASDSGEQHLARYAGIDIALDTFPFTGSTTTFEALWMGVPVITLLGDHMVARWSGAMLMKLKLDELIAHNEDQYVKIAQGLAQNLDRLEALRAGLRERVAKSPLCDEKGRAHQLERAFRWMWAKWCAEQAT